MNLKKLLLCISVAGMVASCTSDIDLYDVDVANEQEGDVRITLRVEPFRGNNDVKTRADFAAGKKNGASFSVDFCSGDKFGIYSLDGQENWPLNVIDEDEEDDVDGFNSSDFGEEVNIWCSVPRSLKKNKKYIVYFPYKYSFDGHTLSFSGQGLPTGKNNGIYYCSEVFTYDGEESLEDLTLKPLMALIKIVVPDLPKGKYSSVGLENVEHNKESFYKSVYVNNLLDEERKDFQITRESKSSSLSREISLLIDGKKGSQNEFYLTVYPSDIDDFRVRVRPAESGWYYSKETFNLKKLKAGKTYVINAELDVPEFYSDGLYLGYDFVDLNLPSKTKWATQNVGAPNAVGLGSYFAWGHVEPINGRDLIEIDTPWAFYKFRDGDKFSKYCTDSKYGKKDSKKTLDAKDDVAQVKWGGNWRMPNKEEWQELLKKCYWVWTTNYNRTNAAGYIVYKARNDADMGKVVYDKGVPSNNYSLEDAHIFLKAQGYYGREQIINFGESVFYWSSSLATSDDSKNEDAYCLFTGSKSYISTFFRYIGMPVRPVYQ